MGHSGHFFFIFVSLTVKQNIPMSDPGSMPTVSKQLSLIVFKVFIKMTRSITGTFRLITLASTDQL